MNRSIIITGANSGIGKEVARQLGAKPETEKIYLACRNEEKAKIAKQELETATERSIFEIIIMDISKPASVIKAVSSLNESIDAVIMNAGGMGGKTPATLTEDGVTNIFAHNLIGHIVLIDELLKADKLKKVALYAGSEAARGTPEVGIKPPNLKTSSVKEFSSIIDGTYFKSKMNVMIGYSLVKYIAALWISSQARNNPNIKFITMSPGATTGTTVLDSMSSIKRLLFKQIMMPLMKALGKAHCVKTGARRFVDGISDDNFKSGTFYASKKGVTGEIIDQSELLPSLNNIKAQDNANKAIHIFIKK